MEFLPAFADLPSKAMKLPLPVTSTVMEDIGKRLAALRIQGKAAIEKIPFEILEQILSYLPRSDRLTTSTCSSRFRKHNKELT